MALLLERRDAEREVPASRAVVLDAASLLAILQHVAWRLSLAGRAELPRDDVLEMVRRAVDRMPNVEYSVQMVAPEVTGRVEAAVDELVPPRGQNETRSLALAGGRVLRRFPATLDGLSDASAVASEDRRSDRWPRSVPAAFPVGVRPAQRGAPCPRAGVALFQSR